MASYLIMKNDKVTSFLYFENNFSGYTFNPKKNKEEYINVKEVTVVHPQLIDNVLSIKFANQFKKLLAMAIAVDQDEDASESDAQRVLGEIELLREIILNRYQKFLRKAKEEMFLRKLRVIENEMRIKILYLRGANTKAEDLDLKDLAEELEEEKQVSRRH